MILGWKIKLFFMILLIQLTGSILLSCWSVMGRFLDKRGYQNILYPFLKGISFFFLCPAVYFFLWFSSYHRSNWGGILFWPTPLLTRIAEIGLVIWMLGMTLMLTLKLTAYWKLKKRLQSKISCNGYKRQQFQEVCKKLHIPIKRVELYESYHVTTPMLAGVLHPAVILPVEEYTEQELVVIFTHELTHYRQRDVWLKHIAAFILSLGWFNPFTYYYCSLVEEWSEYACDVASCREACDVQEYFQVIFSMAEKTASIKSFLYSSLLESEHALIKRVKKMLSYQKIPQRSKMAIRLMCMAVFSVSFTSVTAVSLQAANLYEKVYEATEEAFKEKEFLPIQFVEYVEQVDLSRESGLQMNREVLLWEELTNGKRTAGFRWTIDHNFATESDTFYVSEGQVITISRELDFAHKGTKIGICNLAGKRHYIDAEYGYYYNFYIKESGEYRFFVENLSGESAMINGQIYIQEQKED